MLFPWMSNTTPTKLTVELGQIVENGVDIWDFDYPSFYQGAEKTAFEKKVIDHYRFRQIGQETVGRWLHQFRTRINEIMPYYQQLYSTVKIMDAIEDPFGNVDVTETYEETRTGTSEGEGSSDGRTTSNTTDNHLTKHSDTPQGEISNIDNYMSSADKVNGTSENESTANNTSTTRGSSTETVKHTFRKTGNQGVNTYAHDMIEYRQILINIDMMIIKELNDLFLGVY